MKRNERSKKESKKKLELNKVRAYNNNPSALHTHIQTNPKNNNNTKIL